ncbi:MAG: CBS domain-containing protein, partial [Chloroflexi bacterium]|nr:CBS domain-containing protein [Chloroflexota bacterium]
ELQVAVAGPATSFILAGLFWVVANNIGAASEPVVAVAAYLAYVNGTLGVFNLIPGFPLDGGRAFRAILWLLKPDYRLATRIATRAGKLVAYLFVAIGIFASLNGFWANGVLLVIVGWFLHSAAEMSESQVEAQESLRGIRIGELGAGSTHTVMPNLTLQQLVDEHLTAHRERLFPVVQDGILLGLISSRQVRRIPQRLWGVTQAASAMLPRDRVATLEPEVTASEALVAMGERGLGYILVAQGDRFIGLVTVDDLLELARARHELGL